MKKTIAAGLLLAVAGFGADVAEGERMFKEKNYSKAETVLREALAEQPENMEARYYLGMSLLELKKYNEAAEYLEKAVEAKPEARVPLANAYTMQKRYTDAVRVVNAALQDQPDSAAAHREKGLALLQQEKFQEAAAELAKAVELDPKDAYAHYYYGMASSRINRKDLMVKHFRLFLELAPNAPEAEKVRSFLRNL